MNGRVGVLEYEMLNPPAFGDVGPGVHSAGGREGRGFGTILNGTISANYILNPTFVVVDTSTSGFTRLDTAAEPPRMDENVGRDILGIPGTNGADGEREYRRVPELQRQQLRELRQGDLHLLSRPRVRIRRECELVQDTHNVRFGINVARQKMDNFEVQGAGAFSFAGGFDGAARRRVAGSVQQHGRLPAGIRVAAAAAFSWMMPPRAGRGHSA